MPSKPSKKSRKHGREKRKPSHQHYVAGDRATKHKLVHIRKMCRKHPAYAAGVRRGDTVPQHLADRLSLTDLQGKK